LLYKYSYIQPLEREEVQEVKEIHECNKVVSNAVLCEFLPSLTPLIEALIYAEST
jgi:hypothetical protein